MAQPPGKKLQSLTLLSGGEQALTAVALIFALFLTNPAPICVLDEVDAPLDDANIERFCDLLEAMTRETATRYLIVTHNAATMSRMHRLFGVTMVERGVSRLVSVDLGGAGWSREEPAISALAPPRLRTEYGHRRQRAATMPPSPPRHRRVKTKLPPVLQRPHGAPIGLKAALRPRGAEHLRGSSLASSGDLRNKSREMKVTVSDPSRADRYGGEIREMVSGERLPAQRELNVAIPTRLRAARFRSACAVAGMQAALSAQDRR
jgi:hypothetical protein